MVSVTGSAASNEQRACVQVAAIGHKAKGQLVDPLDILNAAFLKDPDASVWVSAPGNASSAPPTGHGDCPNRRCKWSHAETIAPPWSPWQHRSNDGAARRAGADGGQALDGAVPKAEFNDGSVLVTRCRRASSRAGRLCSRYRAGAARPRAGRCGAAALSAGVRAHKDAARPPPARAGGRGAGPEGGYAVRFGRRDRRRPPRARLRCGAARRLPRVLPAGSEPTAAARKKAPASRPFNNCLKRPRRRAVAAVIGALPDAGAGGGRGDV